MQKPVVLIILDGWGLAPPGPGNAISLARLTNIPTLWNSYPHAQLSASGEAVGLPEGEDGNTETGHLNIGSGRVVYQSFPRINASIADGTFAKNKTFSSAFNHARKHRSNLHIMGLLTDSAVHASRDHLYQLLETAKAHGFTKNLYLHIFTDGRDSHPQSGKRFIAELEAKIHALGVGQIATVMGRFYAMDRDRRWERTEKAYKALTEDNVQTSPDAVTAIEQAYAKGQTDEFIEPMAMVDKNGAPFPRIHNKDAVIFFNFRIDRPRQLTKAFVLPRFEEEAGNISSFDPYAIKYHHKHTVVEEGRTKPFYRHIVLNDLFFVTMTEYEQNLPCAVAFPPEKILMPLGEVLSKLNLEQLRVAETEKERFITYYFNGLREGPLAGEERLIVHSPQVATYDLQPEMAIAELSAKVIERVSRGTYAFIAVNIPNSDMVAHTGNIPAAVRACEVVDNAVGNIVNQILSIGGACVITADHGNVEEMLGSEGQMDTEHSTFPVPFIFIDPMLKNYPTKLPDGKLADIATTILSYMNIPIPKEMTGKNLLADLPARNANA